MCLQNRDMRREIADESFGTVIDKGTLDAILCGDNAHESAARLLLECSRCDRPLAPFAQRLLSVSERCMLLARCSHAACSSVVLM